MTEKYQYEIFYSVRKEEGKFFLLRSSTDPTFCHHGWNPYDYLPLALGSAFTEAIGLVHGGEKLSDVFIKRNPEEFTEKENALIDKVQSAYEALKSDRE